ncbi:MAG: hypothetical protein ACSLFR_02400 [Solirubrobacteraceae bacterium]
MRQTVPRRRRSGCSAAAAAARWVAERTGLALPGMVHRVDAFPPQAHA